MRIALLTHDIPGNTTSGVGSYTLHCAAALARNGQHEPHIFTFGATKETHRLLPSGVHLHSVPGLAEGIADARINGHAGAILGNTGLVGQLFAQSELLCQALRDAHKSSPFDIIETPEVCFPGLPLLLRPIQGTPVVTMLHAGTAISRHFNDLAPSEDDQLLMALEFATIAMADALCAPTRAVVETTRRFLPFTQDVDLFPSPVPNAECIHTPTHDVPPGSYVMFAGRVERLKGCCELALAANTFLRACPAAELRLYGPDRPLSSAPATLTSNNPWNGGSTREWMLAHLDADVLSRVRFMGTKPPSEMSTAYAAARFVVAPSRFENFGTTAAEALIAGRPVIYSAGTGLEETVADAGLPARPEDPEHLAAQMIRLWTDAPLRHSLAARGTDRLKHELSIETAIARRIAFYRKTIAQPSLNPSEKIRRLAALPPSSLHAVLQYASGITARLAAIPSSDTSSPGTRAARALEKLRHSGKPLSSLWLYGAGQHTRRLLVEREIIQHAGTRIRGIIDDSARPGDTLFDLPLLTRTAAESQHRDRQITIDALILSSDSLEETLWLNSECFRRQNIPVVRLYS